MSIEVKVEVACRSKFRCFVDGKEIIRRCKDERFTKEAPEIFNLGLDRSDFACI